MSYILEALRRADAERDRGAVPGLHSQPLAQPAAPGAARSAPWAAGAAVALAAAALALAFTWRDRALPPPAPFAGAAPAPDRVTGAPATAAVPSAVQQPATAAPALQAPAAAPRLPPPQAASPAPAAPAQQTPSAPLPTAAQALDPAPMPAMPAPQTTTAATPTPATATRPVVPFDRLPDDVRRSVPVLAIGGAIYSDNAAARMLIVGGQLLHEGDTVAPGLTLEQIKPKSAVLRWRDWRYELPL